MKSLLALRLGLMFAGSTITMLACGSGEDDDDCADEEHDDDDEPCG